MKNSIRKELELAGRYDDVLTVLRQITEDKSPSFTVYLFMERECEELKPKDFVKGDNVRKEASELISRIKDDSIMGSSVNEFDNLFKYLDKLIDNLSYNYVVSLSHRQPPYIDLERIRTLLIIWNLLAVLDEEEITEWYIPDGWKRLVLKVPEKLKKSISKEMKRVKCRL